MPARKNSIAVLSAITYRESASQPQRTLKAVSGFLDVPYSWNAAWWRSGSHIIGGNRIVAAQVEQEPAGIAAAVGYLDGKYNGRFHTIFYDAQWRANAGRLSNLRGLYQELGPRLEALLEVLGQPDCRQMECEL